MNTNTANAGTTPSERTLSLPARLDADADRLVVTDVRNSRVLVWKQLPVADFQPASVAVGAKDFQGVQAAERTLRLDAAFGVHLVAGKLYVLSSAGNRILVWNSVPTSLGEPAAAVLGQADFETADANDARLAPVERLSYPMGMTTAAGRLFIADRHNNRVVVAQLPQ